MDKETTSRHVILFLDEVGLAEQSPFLPLKALHSLLENPEIPFIGLSRTNLDRGIMNRVILHCVIPPSKYDLEETAKKIISEGGGINLYMIQQLEPRISKIAKIYQNIMRVFSSLLLVLSFQVSFACGWGASAETTRLALFKAQREGFFKLTPFFYVGPARGLF